MIKLASGEWKVAETEYNAAYKSESVAGLLASGAFDWSFS